MENLKVYTLFAGPNGVGKSTLYAADNSENLGLRLNSDEMVKASGADWRDIKAQLEAGRKLLLLQNEYFKKGLSFNQETTLCGVNIIKTIQKAKELGYVINLRFVSVNSSKIAKERIARRISLGGHGVDEETIERRFQCSIENLIKILPICDNINIYDNSGDGLVLAAYSVEKVLRLTTTDINWVNEIVLKINKK